MNIYNNFAVMSYSFHGLISAGAMDVFGYLETVRYRYGLGTADIWNGLLKSFDEDYLKLVKQHVDERGLTVVNLCCDGCHVWADDAEGRAELEKKAWQNLRAAEILEAKTIRIDAGVQGEDFSEENFEYVAKKYAEYCKRAAEFGAALGTENHWGATRSIENVRRLYSAVTEPNFKLLLHLGNWRDGGEDQKDLNDLEMIIKAMHMHCNYEHCIDADRVLPPLFAKGYGGCWTVESHKGFNEYNNVAFQLAQMRRVIAPLYYNMKDKIVTIPEGVKV
ncbi:MAG: sugar phosphate isomerase/epimerase [Defluviitaleaceae bacterium]|nr:sugar phosphate isomerase/epimerase [Defluviitaleaceae bacterium]